MQWSPIYKYVYIFSVGALGVNEEIPLFEVFEWLGLHKKFGMKDLIKIGGICEENLKIERYNAAQEEFIKCFNSAINIKELVDQKAGHLKV